MHRITRKLEFDAGHRVLYHEGKCANLHGHRYVAEITVASQELDELGRVIDFSVIKSLVGGWIDAQLDHNMLLHPDDPLLLTWYRTRDVADIIGRTPYIMPAQYQNPTAENISRLIFDNASGILHHHGLTVERVRLYETPNSWADWSGE